MTGIFCAVLFVFVFPGCDILRTSPFEVNAWSPGEGFCEPSAVQTISLAFSLEPDRVPTENAFLFYEGESVLPGHFSWQGRKMIWTPQAPLSANRDYRIVLKTEAQDTRGLSLERQFEAAFTTRPQRIRPVLLETLPREGEILPGSRDRVELVFSCPLNRSSLDRLSFSPSIAGVWSLEENRALWTPSEDWVNGRSYRLNIGSALKSFAELEAGRDHVLHFSAGLDRTAPELVHAAALDKEGGSIFLATGGTEENAFWERTHRLLLTFSEAVDSASVSAALYSEPSFRMEQETPPGNHKTLVYRFADTPPQGTSWTLVLGQNVRDPSGNVMNKSVRWRIRAGGTASMPPVLRGMRLPLPSPNDPGMLKTYSPEILFADFPVTGAYAFDTGTAIWMELYFETAPGASIDLFSLMELFRLSATNTALFFSPRTIRSSDFSLPPAEGWENLERVEIGAVLTNRPYTGVVTLEIKPGLKDSLGNKSTESFFIQLLK